MHYPDSATAEQEEERDGGINWSKSSLPLYMINERKI